MSPGMNSTLLADPLFHPPPPMESPPPLPPDCLPLSSSSPQVESRDLGPSAKVINDCTYNSPRVTPVNRSSEWLEKVATPSLRIDTASPSGDQQGRWRIDSFDDYDGDESMVWDKHSIFLCAVKQKNHLCTYLHIFVLTEYIVMCCFIRHVMMFHVNFITENTVTALKWTHFETLADIILYKLVILGRLLRSEYMTGSSNIVPSLRVIKVCVRFAMSICVEVRLD